MSQPPPLPAGYQDLAGDCQRFLRDHPDYDRNVFIMTRFVPGDRLLDQLDLKLRRTLCRHNLTGLRADDRVYPIDRQLWKNVCVYMLCCSYGIAVLEDRIKDEFNPNVALEYGFMRALDKPTLLLKDIGFHNLRADILGTLHEPFDIADIAGSLARPVENWIRDLGIEVEPGPSELEQCAFKAYRRLLNIKCAGLLPDEASRKKERDDEFWYFGEEVESYRKALRRTPDRAHLAALEDAAQSIAQAQDLAALPGLVERFSGLSRRAP
ncbi:MAG: hypothetical protein ACXWCO_13010 [Caldimonas sp.]